MPSRGRVGKGLEQHNQFPFTILHHEDNSFPFLQLLSSGRLLVSSVAVVAVAAPPVHDQ